jgi:hypothetical protein
MSAALRYSMNNNKSTLSVSELAALSRSKRAMVTLPGVSCESRKQLADANAMPVECEAIEALRFANILAGRA